MIGYQLLFWFVFVESLAFLGLLIPGPLIIIAAGFAAALGYLDIGDIVFFVVLAAVIGDILSYYLGWRRRNLQNRESRVLRLEYLEKGKRFFAAYGYKGIFYGKFSGFMRPIMPFTAGISRVKIYLFFVYDFLAILIWSGVYVFGGYYLGVLWQILANWSTRLSLFLATVALFLAVFLALKWLIIKSGRQFYAIIRSFAISFTQGILQNVYIKKFIVAHPGLSLFVKKRMDKEKLSGLPLTLLVVVFLYFCGLFAGSVWGILNSGPIVLLDKRVENLLLQFRNPQLTEVFLWITMLGAWQMLTIKAFFLSIILWLWRRRYFIPAFWFGFIGTEFSVWLFKNIFHRARPLFAVYQEHSFSFPSGHAAMAAFFYGFVVYIFWRSGLRWRRKIDILFLGAIFIIAIGFSRMYLGVHYLSDVSGGYQIGFLWLLVAIAFSEFLKYWQTKKQVKRPVVQSSVSINIKLLSWGMLFLTIVIYTTISFYGKPELSPPVDQNKTKITKSAAAIFADFGLPKYTETPSGNVQEPISFIIAAKNNQEMEAVFRAAGWHLADKISLNSLYKLLKAVIKKEDYLTAPMTPSFWDTKVHALGFEKATPSRNASERHHVRFWLSGLTDQEGRQIYIGTASLDIGIKWGVTHKIEPDIDTEREFLFNDLKNTGQLLDYQKIKLVKPVLGKNFSGDPFFTDGEAYVIKI